MESMFRVGAGRLDHSTAYLSVVAALATVFLSKQQFQGTRTNIADVQADSSLEGKTDRIDSLMKWNQDVPVIRNFLQTMNRYIWTCTELGPGNRQQSKEETWILCLC